jgi:E3 ubiquitin-protein ligase TRIP12
VAGKLSVRGLANVAVGGLTISRLLLGTIAIGVDHLFWDGGISIEALRENVIPFGYAPESVELHILFKVLAEMDVKLQGLFLRFVTGSNRLSIGGLAKLHPKLTVAQVKASNHDTLPSATVCQHYFKLPQYASKEVMRVKVIRAITDGQDAFTFS